VVVRSPERVFQWSHAERTGGLPQLSLRLAMTHPAAPPRTVAEWFNSGYRGLRIPHCPACRMSTWSTWDELDAEAAEDVVDVARRLRCVACGEAPAGLAVVASTDDEEYEPKPH
jgi:hypothetical protein